MSLTLLTLVAAAGLLVLWALRRCPLVVLAVLAAAGFVVVGSLPLPAAAREHVEDARVKLRAWQDNRIAGYVCYGRLRQAADSQTPEAIQRAEHACRDADNSR